jgi:helix-turn-helix, Psq domain
MVRTYQRKSTRGSHGKDALDMAIQKVKTGEMSKRKASGTYGVPRKTLNIRRMRARRSEFDRNQTEWWPL